MSDKTDAQRADAITTLFWDNFLSSERAHIMRNVIEIELDNVRQVERKRCADIIGAARFGDIDGDLRSLISRIRSGDDTCTTKDDEDGPR